MVNKAYHNISVCMCSVAFHILQHMHSGPEMS